MNIDPKTEQLAGALYQRYCAAVGGKAFNGDPLPDWAEFRSDSNKALQSNAWLAAAQLARDKGQRLRDALNALNFRAHSNYDFNADPDNITLMVGDALDESI